VIQEYLQGPSFSLEVIGWDDSCRILQVTDLEMDAGYDCKRVLAPSVLPPVLQKKFAKIGKNIAGQLRLKGIMDIEVILHEGELKVLEIDARLPSQTPICVYHSSGINMIELIVGIFLDNALPEQVAAKKTQHVLLEHVKLTPEKLEVCGENLVGGSGPLICLKDFFGADEALTDYRHGKDHWVATLIIRGKNRKELLRRHAEVVKNICHTCSVSEFLDPVPLLVQS
jgi:pyrrolysine biosynthesis protein PylC